MIYDPCEPNPIRVGYGQGQVMVKLKKLKKLKKNIKTNK